jgi:hypothetical protein
MDGLPSWDQTVIRVLKAAVAGTVGPDGRPVDVTPFIGLRVKWTKRIGDRVRAVIDAGHGKPGHIVVFPSVASYEAAVILGGGSSPQSTSDQRGSCVGKT